jgi:tetratricopeptide (TPR) repeat protein
MSNDDSSGKVLPFKRPSKRRQLPPRDPRFHDFLHGVMELVWGDLEGRKSVFDHLDVEEGLAWAEEAIAQGLPEGREARADALNLRAYRALVRGDADSALAEWNALVEEYPGDVAAHVMRARFHAYRGDDAAAVADFDRAVELAPTDPAGYRRRAAHYEAQGDGPRALANFRRAAQLDPSSDEALLGLARRLQAEGDAKGATRVYTKAAEKELGDAESYNMRGFMHFVVQQYELAIADYQASLALNPMQSEAVSWRGLSRLMLKRYEPAAADFTRLIAMKPAEPFGYWRRGEALVGLGRHAEALPDLDRAIALGPDERGAAHALRGNALVALGDVDGALRAFDVAVEREPKNVANRLWRYKAHAEKGNWPACMLDADALLELLPDNPDVLLGHARMCITNERRNDARADLDKLIALVPEHADAHYERGQLYVGEGDSLKARDFFARAHELKPSDPEITAQHGRYQMMFARTEEERAAGKQFIDASVELDAENPEAWARAAYHLRGAGQPAEAVAYISRALELDPENVEYLRERSTCLRCGAPPFHGDPDGFHASCERALADIEHAMELSEEDDLELYRSRASLREDLDDVEGAIADQTKLIELDPEFIDAWMDRATLRERIGDMEGARADAARAREMEDAWRAEMAAYVDVSGSGG